MRYLDKILGLLALTCAATFVGSCSDAPAAGECRIDECGITCFDEDLCASCGNNVCEWFESIDSCNVDCCDANLCNPNAGARYSGGDSACVGAPEGARCDDGSTDNGVETCREGLCRHEHDQCLCQGSVFPNEVPSLEGVEEASSPEHPVWRGSEPTEESFAGAWGLKRIDTSRAWERTRGDPSVRVAVVDSGCDERNADLAGQIIAQELVVEGEPSSAEFERAHGTFLASVIAGLADGGGVVGVAPGVRLLCARVATGAGEDARADYPDIAAGIDWAVAQDADVILVPLGGAASSEELEQAVIRAADAGAVLVAPSGSTGGGNMDLFPAAYPQVISVAASNQTDLPDPGTDLSTTTDLLAPGWQVLGTVRADVLSMENGSSVAAAYVAGAAALVLSAEPTLTAAQVRALLETHAVPVPMHDFDRFFRARRLDVGAAVAAASPVRVDVAISRASFVGPSGLPGAPRHVRVRVENRGTVDAEDVTVRATVDIGAVVALGGVSGDHMITALTAGESREVVFEVTPPIDAVEVEVRASASVASDAEPNNDELAVTGSFGPQVHHLLRIERVEMQPPPAGATEREVNVVVENFGNVPEGPSVLRVLEPNEGDGTALPVPALEPGERVELTTTANPSTDSPEARHVVAFYQQPAPGQTDTLTSSAWINYRSDPVTPPQASPQYAQYRGAVVTADAPWRTIRDTIPVLVFYPSTSWTQAAEDTNKTARMLQAIRRALENDFGRAIAGRLEDLGVELPEGLGNTLETAELLTRDLQQLLGKSTPGSVRMWSVGISNPVAPENDPPSIYQEAFGVRPDPDGSQVLASSGRSSSVHVTRAPDGVRITDEFGLPAPTALIRAPTSGAHRQVWLPTSALDLAPRCRRGAASDDGAPRACHDHRGNPNANGWFLRVSLSYGTYLGQNVYQGRSDAYKVLFVAKGDEPFPTLHGDNGHYFDPHFHSAAEFWPGTYLLGPAKAFGGPVEALFATAWSLGMIEMEEDPSVGLMNPAQRRDQVIITDHNTFFEDQYAPLGWGQAAPADPFPESFAPLESGWSSRPTTRGVRDTEREAAIRWEPRPEPLETGAAGPDPRRTGSPEFDRIRAVVGSTAGEEVSLWGGPAGTRPQGAVQLARLISSGGDLALMGRHALLYDQTHHVNGVWGTPDVNHCTPSYQNFLTRLGGGANGRGTQSICGSLASSDRESNGANINVVGGFTYAAHPFDGIFLWHTEVMRHALSLPKDAPTAAIDGFEPDRQFLTDQGGVTPMGGDFVMRGLQFWNWREGQRVRTAPADLDTNPDYRRRLNPFAGGAGALGPWEPSCGQLESPRGAPTDGYRNEFFAHLRRYLDHLQSGLGMTLGNREVNAFREDGFSPRFIRKVFMIAGSDAHGDFNWHQDIMTTRLQLATSFGDLPIPGVSDGPIGGSIQFDGHYASPRTYVFGRLNPARTAREEPSLEDLRRGRAVSTDGPVLDFYIDSEARGTNFVRRGSGSRPGQAFVWHDDSDEFQDLQGFMGGDGPRDGEGTVLIPVLEPAYEGAREDPEAQRPMVRLDCQNIPEFGGAQPTGLELFQTTRSSAPILRRVDLLREETRCDGTAIDRVLDLDNLDEPSLLIAHVEFDEGCPAIYEAWTNPIWVAPVRVRMPKTRLWDRDDSEVNDLLIHAVPGFPVDAAPEDQGVVEIEFPISMKDTQVIVQVAGITASTDCPDGETCVGYNLIPFTGGVDGSGGLEPVLTHGGRSNDNGWYPALDDAETTNRDESASNSILRVRFPTGENAIRWTIDPVGFFQDSEEGEEFRQSPGAVLIVRGTDGDRFFPLNDFFDNPLNPLMVRFQPDYVETRFDAPLDPPPGDRTIMHCVMGPVPRVFTPVDEPVTGSPGVLLTSEDLLTSWGETLNTDGEEIEHGVNYAPWGGTVSMSFTDSSFPVEGRPACGPLTDPPPDHRHHRAGHTVTFVNPSPLPPPGVAVVTQITRYEFPIPEVRSRPLPDGSEPAGSGM